MEIKLCRWPQSLHIYIKMDSDRDPFLKIDWSEEPNGSVVFI